MLIRAIVVLACALSGTAGSAGAQSPPPILSLEDALQRGEQHSPRVRAADAKREAWAGDRLQAAARPNPEFTLDGENFAGNKDYAGFRSVEVTAGLSQKIELGGKRQARIDLADAGGRLAGHERERDLLALREEIARAYVAALYADRLAMLEAGRLENAQSLASAVRERVQNGREPAVQLRKGEIALSSAQVAQQRARREYQASLATLAGVIGLPAVTLALDTGWFDQIDRVFDPPPDEVALNANPDYARLETAIAQARAAVVRSETESIPDPTLSAGVRRFRESDSSAFVVGLSIPIPVFDRNAGTIQRARQDLIRAEAEAAAERISLRAGLFRARQALEASQREVEVVRTTILPAAAETLDAAREGYRAGKFGFLDLLDAQRTEFDVKAQLAAALRDYHLARIELMRLVGRTY